MVTFIEQMEEMGRVSKLPSEITEQFGIGLVFIEYIRGGRLAWIKIS